MKKVCFALILSLAMMCMHSVIAGASDGYTPIVNSYTNSASNGAKTVLIYKGTPEDEITAGNIYYINQSDSDEGFSNLEMIMKSDVPAGVYTLATNGNDCIATFEISEYEAAIAGLEEMRYLGARLNKDGTYSVAYGISVKSSLTEESKLSMLWDGKLYATNLIGAGSIVNWFIEPVTYKDAQGAERVMFAIQIDGVGAEYVEEENGIVTPDFSLYFED